MQVPLEETQIQEESKVEVQEDEQEEPSEPKHVKLMETRGEQITEIEVVKKGNNEASPFIS